MKGLILRAVRVLVAIFYRRVDVVGLENVPEAGPVLLVANHFNSLVDPMLVMATFGRPVVFVAKSTLWKVPVLKAILNTLGVVPVVRRADVAGEGEPGGADRNEKSFARLADVLRDGGVVLIFPEGRSHSEPRLSAVKTGAARILLQSGAKAAVLPVGLWFVKKEEFRSDVLVQVGAPLRAERDNVESWTEAIRAGLEGVTLNAESWDEHEIVRAVEIVYGRALSDGAGTLESSFRNRRILLLAHPVLARVEPGATARLARRARAFARLLRRAGLAPGEVQDLSVKSALIVFRRIPALALAILGFPIALAGLLAFWAPYRLTGVAAKRLVPRPELLDVVSLYKILAGLVLFPLALALETAAAWKLAGPYAALVALLGLPLCGAFALWFLEDRNWKSFVDFPWVPDTMATFRRESDALRAECDRLADVYRRATADRPAVG